MINIIPPSTEYSLGMNEPVSAGLDPTAMRETSMCKKMAHIEYKTVNRNKIN